MRKKMIAVMMLVSAHAFAADVNYTCKNQRAIDVGLPSSIYVQLEGNSVSLQDDSNDLYHKGKLTDRFEGRSQVAVGFKALILDSDGRVLISKSMLNGRKKATLTIVDDALDSTYNKYKCKKLD